MEGFIHRHAMRKDAPDPRGAPRMILNNFLAHSEYVRDHLGEELAQFICGVHRIVTDGTLVRYGSLAAPG